MNKIYWWTTQKKRNNFEEFVFWLNKKVHFKITIQTLTWNETFFILKNSTFKVVKECVDFSYGIYYQPIGSYESNLRPSLSTYFKDRLKEENILTFKELTEEEFNNYKIIER